MSITVDRLSPFVSCVSVQGRLDHLLAPRLEEVLHAQLADGYAKLILDCSQIAYVNSAALRVLIGAWREARENDGDLVLCALNGRLQTVLHMVGFHKILTLYDTQTEAQAAFDVAT